MPPLPRGPLIPPDSDFLKSAQAADDPEFRLRVRSCLLMLAVRVLEEDPQVEGHEKRARLAGNVVRDPDPFIDLFAMLCGAAPAVQATVTRNQAGDIEVTCPDADIEAVCDSSWDAVAGWR